MAALAGAAPRRRGWRSRRRRSTTCSRRSRRPLKPYAAAVRAAGETRPLVRAFAPDVVVSDILTPAPALAAELEGVPVATLVPHVYPARCRRACRRTRSGRGCRGRRVGRALWRGFDPLVGARARARAARAQRVPRAARARAAAVRAHRRVAPLALVATFPQLEYPRDWPSVAARGRSAAVGAAVRARGAAAGRRPARAGGALDGAGPEHRLLRAALAGLAGERVRVLATWNGRRAGPAAAGAGERRAGGVAVVLAHDAAPATWW